MIKSNSGILTCWECGKYDALTNFCMRNYVTHKQKPLKTKAKHKVWTSNMVAQSGTKSQALFL